MGSIKFLLAFALGFFGIIWLFNFSKLNQLEDRYDNALEEHNRLIKQIERDSIIIDSLQNIYYELVDTVEYESIDTTIIDWSWGREEIYYFKYKKEYDPKSLLNALIHVESSNNDSAYRASEDAVGCLQIRKTMVNDVNRILKRQKSTLRFTYNDRWSRNKSIQMFNIYCNYYNLTTAEEIARCWNGGPRGINNPATVRYWEKVKDKINS